MSEQAVLKSRILKLIEDGTIDEAAKLMKELTDMQTSTDHELMVTESKIIDSLASSTVADLMKRFPEGFVVSPSGQLFVILAAVSSMQYLSVHHATPPPRGGYVVVSVPSYQEGDEKFGVMENDTEGNSE